MSESFVKPPILLFENVCQFFVVKIVIAELRDNSSGSIDHGKISVRSLFIEREDDKHRTVWVILPSVNTAIIRIYTDGRASRCFDAIHSLDLFFADLNM